MNDIVISKWKDILEYLRTQFNISNVSFTTWFSDLKCREVRDNTVILCTEDDSNIQFIKDKYSKFIKIAIAEVTGLELDFDIVADKVIFTPPVEANKVMKNYTGLRLNSDYTFENFVVSSNNTFVHAASLKVAEAPGKIYNPLYIYGNPGLGKTHLMQAIAHFILDNSPNLRVNYVTSDIFTNELIDSIRHGTITPADFRAKYHNVDVLLIDDIQFIIGKESTQEEFFHTFNYLYEMNKQIVISSDKPPKDFKNLEERLSSRFECGLIYEIMPPNYETKMAILKKKHEMKQLETGSKIVIEDEVFPYIANNINTNIRSLEGALTKIIAYSRINHTPIDLELAKVLLRDIISPNVKKVITPDLIIEIIAEHFNISVNDIKSEKKDKRFALPRQMGMYLTKKYTNSTSSAIAEAFGKDHSTVSYGIKKIEELIETNSDIASKIDTLTKKLNIEE